MKKKFGIQPSLINNYKSIATLENTPGLPDTFTVQGPKPVGFQIVKKPSYNFSKNLTGANTPTMRNSTGSPLNGDMNAVAKLAIRHSN